MGSSRIHPLAPRQQSLVMMLTSALLSGRDSGVDYKDHRGSSHLHQRLENEVYHTIHAHVVCLGVPGLIKVRTPHLSCFPSEIIISACYNLSYIPLNPVDIPFSPEDCRDLAQSISQVRILVYEFLCFLAA